MTSLLQHYVTAFSTTQFNHCLTGIGRGIEREALRIDPEGELAVTPHNKQLGSALTHPQITTDYAEALLEFITPVSYSPEESLAQLKDVQKFTLSKIGDEMLWPMSMPCYVGNEDNIELAQYGKSNVGKMKTVYRQGLKNRYGSMMQIISGIHFNFSFSQAFWQALKEIDNVDQNDQDFISEKYFALIRNYKRFAWLIPYLYGSSPAICPSFLQGKNSKLPFEKSPSGAVYLPFATSLRMSDLGYTNSAQSQLKICYNNLTDYVDGVKNAINLPSEKFARLGVKVDGQYRQLNSNILQIENELYAPIRPKQVAQSGEKPSQALRNRGVEYVEVRALDVNPFISTGIDVQQIYFLDVFLTFCVLAGNDELDCDVQQRYDENTTKVINEGRKPNLMLNDGGVEKTLVQWGHELFEQFAQVAQLLDNAYKTGKYSEAVVIERMKINDSSLTPSAKVVHLLVQQKKSLTATALANAKHYKAELEQHQYQFFTESYFNQQAVESLRKQQVIEESDTESFDQFLDQYFSH